MAKLKRPSLPSRNLGKVKNPSKTSSISQFECVRAFTVFWVDNNGRNFNTSGFGARLFNTNGVEVSRAFFNSQGHVCFFNITLPTNQRFTIQTFRLSDGLIFRTRTILANTGAFAVIG